MQIPPLTFDDFSLILGISVLVLLIVLELSSPYFGYANLFVNKRKLKNIIYVTGLAFLLTAVIRIVALRIIS